MTQTNHVENTISDKHGESTASADRNLLCLEVKWYRTIHTTAVAAGMVRSKVPRVTPFTSMCNKVGGPPSMVLGGSCSVQPLAVGEPQDASPKGTKLFRCASRLGLVTKTRLYSSLILNTLGSVTFVTTAFSPRASFKRGRSASPADRYAPENCPCWSNVLHPSVHTAITIPPPSQNYRVCSVSQETQGHCLQTFMQVYDIAQLISHFLFL